MHLKNVFVHKLRDCPHQQLQNRWDDPELGGSLAVRAMIEIAQISIDFSKGGGLYILNDVELNNSHFDLIFLYSGKSGNKKFREKLMKSYNEKEWDYNPIELYKPPKMDFDNYLDYSKKLELHKTKSLSL